MVEKKLLVQNPNGLHARPAAKFVQSAKLFEATITLIKGDKTGNGKSLIAVMSLGISQGTEIVLQADGEDEVAALQALQELVEGHED